MAWRETLSQLKEDVSGLRARRLRQAEAEERERQRRRDGLVRLSQSLGFSQLLAEMNATLLDGAGSVETVLSWESEENGQDGDDLVDLDRLDGLDQEEEEEEQPESIDVTLFWNEGGYRELAIQLTMDDREPYLLVNGVEVRPEGPALEASLVQAFRDELDL